MKQNAKLNEKTPSGETVIKSINQRVYTALDRFGEIIQGKPIWIKDSCIKDEHYLINFDTAGKKLKKVYFDEKDDVIRSILYLYDGEYLIEETSTSIKNKDSWSENYRKIRLYDAEGRLTEYKDYREDGTIRTCLIYKYSQESELSIVKVYDSEGILQRKIIQNFDASGFIVKEEHYSQSGHLVEVEQYTYKEEKLVEYYTYMILNGKRCMEKTKRYDDNCRLIYKSFGNSYEKYEYDVNGFVIKYTKDQYGSSDYNTDICNYSYEVNHNNNWIKKTHFRNEIPFAITIREIEYH